MRVLRLIALMAGVMTAAAGEPMSEWIYETPAMPHSPTLYPDASHPTGVAVAADTVIALLNGAGAAQWRMTAEKPVASCLTVAELDGDQTPEVVAVLSNADVLCLDAAGAVRWRHAFHTGADTYAMAVAADIHPSPGQEVVVGFMDGWLNCLSAGGALLWRFFGDRYRVGPAAVADVDGDGAAEVVYGTDNGNVYCLTGQGAVKWRYSEFAPYGRSGVNLADLDGDKKAEVLLTRSNNGLDRCLMALDGATGACKWRTKDVMQGYVSNAVADVDGDGQLEVLHGDKGNWLYCTKADGSETWRTALSGRGLFWAPAVGDLNGDGRPEILATVRDTDPMVGACAFLLSSEGAILEPLKLGGNANAGPALGDIDGDGQLEALLPTQGPNGLQCLSWAGTGSASWPSLRGNSALTGNSNLPAGGPEKLAEPPKKSRKKKAPPEPELPAAGVLESMIFLGENTLDATWAEPVPRDAFAVISSGAAEGAREIAVTPLPEGATHAALAWFLPTEGPSELSLEIHASQRPAPIATWKNAVTPQPADFCDMDGVAARCAAAVAAGAAAGADTRGIQRRLTQLSADIAAIPVESPETLAARATALRKTARELDRLAQALTAFWQAGNTGSFVYWQDPNPWDTFDPAAMPGAVAASTPITLTACGDEFEDAALNLLNISPEPISVRCTWIKPDLAQGRPERDPELARQITLRRGLRVPAHQGGMVLDALPELDISRTITLAPGEVTQLWLVASTYGLAAGKHALTLYLGSLEEQVTVREVPVTLDVLPISLPVGVYAQMNWVGVNPGETSNQQLQDMIDHGISVAYGPTLPAITVNASGRLEGKIDWTATDAGLMRVPKYFQLLFPAPPALKWPDGVAVREESDAYQRAFTTAVREMVKHLRMRGFDYDRWALYPYDEPWLTGFTVIPKLRQFCLRVKAADAKVRIYADPAGLVRKEYVEEFKNLIDIWQPEMNLLKRDPALVKWFQENAKAFWAYEATDPGKNLLPLGYYRGFAWLAWLYGLDGAGFWVYKYYDLYWPLETSHWSVVYQTDDKVAPSRRWEAVRDGQEDYRLLYVLRQEIEKAESAGRSSDAQRAQALIDEAVEKVIAWQARSIDEITRQTRAYELDYDVLMAYRAKLADEVVRLRQTAAESPAAATK